MKNMRFNSGFAVVTATVILFSISSCKKKDDKMDMATSMPMTTEKNINYPAAYVVNGGSNTISVIRLSDNTVSETIELMGTGTDMIMYPHHISINTDRLAIGVPGMDLSAGHSSINTMGMAGKMLVVNATTGTIIKNMTLPSMNHNTIYSPNGTEIWVPQMDMNGKVLVYDATSYALKNTITVGMMPAELTFSSDSTKAYVANGGDNTITVINVTSKAIIKTIAVGLNPVGAWTGSDGRMYIDNEDGQSISVINVSADTIEQTIALGFMPGIASHNGTKKELWVSDPMNGKVHYWTWDMTMMNWMHGGAFNTGDGAHAITFTLDGATAYVTNQTANTVSVVDVLTHTVSKTITVGTKPNGIAIKM